MKVSFGFFRFRSAFQVLISNLTFRFNEGSSLKWVVGCIVFIFGILGVLVYYYINTSFLLINENNSNYLLLSSKYGKFYKPA